MKGFGITATILALLITFGAVSAQEETPVTRGGQLYDKWWTVTGAPAPTANHPLWASQSTNTLKGADTWRCKECHGWDYLGRDGAYATGSHRTGFPGLLTAAQAKSAAELVAALKGSTDPKHDFSTVMNDAALNDLAAFLKAGPLDPRQHIDYSAKKPKSADLALGKARWSEVCAECHGSQGTDYNFGSEDEPEYVGTVAVDNPQEFFHKVRFGQPASDPRMPAAVENEWPTEEVVSVLAYAQTLPTGKQPAVAASAPAPQTLPTTGGPGVSLLPFAIGATSLLSLAVAHLIRRR
jgi:thiosulfate dehydrogenase